MDYLLPASVYQPPPRLGRARQLNTIIEDNEDMNYGSTSENEGTESDDTIIGRPTTLDIKLIAQRTQQGYNRTLVTLSRGPPSVVSSDCDEEEVLLQSGRNSYSESDAGTVFSESCPSLTGSNTSDATTFHTDSTRNSISSRNSRNRYPSILIPRTSWSSLEGDIKQISFGMSPSTKVRLSSETLDRLPKSVPLLEAPPSLGGGSSLGADSPCPNNGGSAPVTPDLHNIEIIEGQAWTGEQQHQQLVLETPLEIAIDDHHSIFLSPAEAHSTRNSITTRSTGNWSDLIGNFPMIPGATPVEMTPITPSIPRREAFNTSTMEDGVQLPPQAMAMLENINKSHYTASIADSSASDVEQEMKERSAPPSRPRSMIEPSPVSEYSEFSQLTIPSPGGFFSSLKSGARRTWCPPSRRASPPPPSSTTAENFYSAPWTVPAEVKETILEISDDNVTDGPPTVRRAVFDLGSIQPEEEEEEDMYGSGTQLTTSHEYDEAYEEGLIQAAEANMDRTGSWLAAQNTYLAALRETNPLNDPSDFSPATKVKPAEIWPRKDSMESETNKAVRFLEQAKAASSLATSDAQKSLVPSPKIQSTEPVYLQVFNSQKSSSRRTDVFLYASSRWDCIKAMRIALPERHVQSLLNNHTSRTLGPAHARPKYRGPFSQNPRATGDFSRTSEQAEYGVLERQQNALDAMKPNVWALEAQKTILYRGGLMASRLATERLTKGNRQATEANRSTEPQKKRRPRVLDLGGAATASWAWSVATTWPNVTVYTVETKEQAELAGRNSSKKEDDVEAFRPETPKNHRIVSVPHLWQLPFRDNHFDVVSARTMHMYLKAKPVPGVDSIDEWDMTLKECMRVLKPGGILDFFVMDSSVSNSTSSSTNVAAVNLSPSNMTGTNALPTVVPESGVSQRRDLNAEFKSELKSRGYEADGGCSQLVARLSKRGFVGVKRQWIGLPMGRSDNISVAKRTHQRTASAHSTTSNYNAHFQADGTRKPTPFRLAPRPISEVSTISKLVDQYAGVEAVQGPVGSTTDVADMSALLGELLWEEWLVRLRLESGTHTTETALEGAEELFGEWRRSGKAAWRGLIGWARKPTRKQALAAEQIGHTGVAATKKTGPDVARTLPAAPRVPLPVELPATPVSAPVGIKRREAVRLSRNMTSQSAGAGLSIDTFSARQRFGVGKRPQRASELSVQSLQSYTISAVERGEAAEVPMMILN